ncbi:hypothetical protein CRG98_017629 [Punica granatum]|uniref:Uncharacterized protein n=1 Tax=Punica granatum TaxID=22663 RepID=A0A2I0K0B0_PUNGR|nr:hypothetical protein CRG98_017629 [Punica granatum]
MKHRGVSDSLMPRISVNHGMTIMPLSGRTVGDVAVGVARLGLKSRMGDPGRRRPLPVGEKQVGTLASATARCEVGSVGLLRGGST